MTNLVRCIIVDDEHGAIEVLKKYVSKVSWLQLDATFTDPLEALNHLSQNSVDLVFMDINMPDLSGLQLSRLIPTDNTSVIFCTAYSQHAVESYEIPALDYLLKPIPFDRFLAAVNKFSKPETETPSHDGETGKINHKIFIKSGSQIHQVDTRKISLIQKDGHYIIFKIDGKELLSRMTFAQLLELLPGDEFIQIHRSYLVAIPRIEVIHKQFVQIDGKEIPIGDSYKQAFFEQVNFIGN
ncbi:MAG: response regulator transcription factor [FCB group bacterium]|nr:response regulator transcription factor [FCB group bacterium]MBL7027198.1 response regulator transcription factor [Candidatus Neomarinimicrobiota bacterium]MBL7120567.1 response regulator transcription factor [Candidatus Neomarinimicrobiota bacterium]